MAEPLPTLIIPNLKKRFSGITSTILQVLPWMENAMQIRVLGNPLPGSHFQTLSTPELCRLARPGNPPVIYHARRNIDMIWGLFFKVILRRNLRLVFTSVAQRHHTRFTRILYRRMDCLLSTSDRSASYLRRKPDAIIPHGTDVDRYQPPIDREREWTESGLPGRYGIGIFGRIRPQKGHAELVDALCRVLPDHPDFTVVIVGETTPKFLPFEEELRRVISNHGLEKQFCWIGKQPFSELPAWFRRMTLVAAVPHNEGFGLTCLEAMASGVPVLATRTGGFEMVIREGVDGFLVPCGDADALKAVLETVLPHPQKLQDMGQAARERIIQSFTAEREARALLEQYRRLLSTAERTG